MDLLEGLVLEQLTQKANTQVVWKRLANANSGGWKPGGVVSKAPEWTHHES